VTICQRAALRYIARRPYARLKEIAYELGISENAAARRVELLKLNGWVRKPMGTRAFVLTPSGVEQVAALAEAVS
jgi:predicted transcriptional regulator